MRRDPAIELLSGRLHAQNSPEFKMMEMPRADQIFVWRKLLRHFVI